MTARETIGEVWVPRRVVVVGTSGVGKSTFAQRLAAVLDTAHVELDALHWEPQWREASDAVFGDRVSRAIDAPSWVLDGNYSKVQDRVWPAADTVVWLDFSFFTVMRRVIGRTFRRSLTQKPLWNGNHERLVTALTSRESIIVWAATTFHRRRREMPARIAQFPHLRALHVRTPHAAENWLQRIAVQLDRPIPPIQPT